MKNKNTATTVALVLTIIVLIVTNVACFAMLNRANQKLENFVTYSELSPNQKRQVDDDVDEFEITRFYDKSRIVGKKVQTISIHNTWSLPEDLEK